jgi:hypothetical protein
MDAYRFGRKIKLPATVAIKHELRMMMAQDIINKAELETVRKASEAPATASQFPPAAALAAGSPPGKSEPRAT